MLKVKLMEGGILPTKAHEGDAGWDLRTPSKFQLNPGCRARVGMRIQIQGERGKYYRVDDKSGLANKGLIVTGGIIDNNYTGEIHVIITNQSETPFIFEVGTKIAQLLVCQVEDDSNIEVVEELEETTRGDGGFGSTGE